MKKPKKPKPPLCRIIREGTEGFCPACGSTYLTRYRFRCPIYLKDFKIYRRTFQQKVQGCIQPECGLYLKE